MIIIGIDPGANGGIAILNGKNIALFKMPETPKDIHDLLKKFHKTDCVCYMENLWGRPGMGGTAMFKMGLNYGHIEMALLTLGISMVKILPNKWQKTFGIGTKSQCATGTIWKNKLKAKAEQLFPKTKIILATADAALIAYYGQKAEK